MVRRGPEIPQLHVHPWDWIRVRDRERKDRRALLSRKGLLYAEFRGHTREAKEVRVATRNSLYCSYLFERESDVLIKYTIASQRCLYWSGDLLHRPAGRVEYEAFLHWCQGEMGISDARPRARRAMILRRMESLSQLRYHVIAGKWYINCWSMNILDENSFPLMHVMQMQHQTLCLYPNARLCFKHFSAFKEPSLRNFFISPSPWIVTTCRWSCWIQIHTLPSPAPAYTDRASSTQRSRSSSHRSIQPSSLAAGGIRQFARRRIPLLLL